MKKAEDCQGNLLGEGFGATPPTPALFRHAEGVEIVGKNRVIAGFRLWRVTFFNSKTPLWQFTKKCKLLRADG